MPTYVYPNPGEETHWAAARLTPPSYPYTVTAIRYHLFGGGLCDNGLEHDVEVFVGTALAPDATPAPLFSATVPASGSVIFDRAFDHVLPSPIALAAGEFLWISVQNAGTALVQSTCITTCAGPAFDPDTNYWSNAGATPYPWATLESFGITSNYAFCADGS